MRKFFSIALAVLLVVGFTCQARAEYSSTSVTGKSYEDQQVFISVYNNYEQTITENYVVVWDLDGTSPDTVATASTMGAFVEVTSTTCNYLTVGVVDKDIPSGKVGRVCIRGPHLVNAESTGLAAVAGYVVGTGDESPYGQMQNYDEGAITSGYLGYIMSANSDGNGNYWVYLCPQINSKST